MSLILEALKKSEQQRRLGEAPTLGSPVVSTRRRRSLLPLFAILIVIAAAAGWWLLRPSAPPPAPATTNATPAPAPLQRTARGTAATGAQDPRAKTPAKPAPISTEANAKRDTRAQTAPAKPAPPAAGALQPATRGPTVVQATSSTSIRTKDAAPAATPAAPAKPQDAGTAPMRQAAITGQPVDARANPSADKPVNAPADQAAAPTTTATAPPATFPAATPRPAPAGPALLSIWELPYSTRKDLPAIDLTMHVYSSNPAQRFVVIKGDRHVEGDEIGQDLVLREIRQDGLVLEYKGQRFLFPRSGR
jgi:general secretion pathway protein B